MPTGYILPAPAAGAELEDGVEGVVERLPAAGLRCPRPAGRDRRRTGARSASGGCWPRRGPRAGRRPRPRPRLGETSSAVAMMRLSVMRIREIRDRRPRSMRRESGDRKLLTSGFESRSARVSGIRPIFAGRPARLSRPAPGRKPPRDRRGPLQAGAVGDPSQAVRSQTFTSIDFPAEPGAIVSVVRKRPFVSSPRRFDLDSRKDLQGGPGRQIAEPIPTIFLDRA